MIQEYYGNDEPERFGFLGPFILGGITGGLVAPYFTGNKGNYYTNYYMPYPTYPGYYYYYPYYR